MGDIVRRGTRDKPKYYGRYFESDGRRKMRLLKGARTKAEAQILLASAELRVSQGQVGIVPLEESQRCGPLMDEWLAGLSNRNAADDRSRVHLHVRSEFADTDIGELQSIALGVRKAVAGILARIRGDPQLESACLREQSGDECCRRRSNFSSR